MVEGLGGGGSFIKQEIHFDNILLKPLSKDDWVGGRSLGSFNFAKLKGVKLAAKGQLVGWPFQGPTTLAPHPAPTTRTMNITQKPPRNMCTRTCSCSYCWFEGVSELKLRGTPPQPEDWGWPVGAAREPQPVSLYRRCPVSARVCLCHLPPGYLFLWCALFGHWNLL